MIQKNPFATFAVNESTSRVKQATTRVKRELRGNYEGYENADNRL